MTALPFVYDDGGRAAAGFRGHTGDCSTRAIAIATETPYKLVYDDMNMYGAMERRTKLHPRKGSARTGVRTSTLRKYMARIGWAWQPTMQIGSGTTVHLRIGELPMGRIIVALSGHLCAVIDGVIHDTGDPSRGGDRCVYGLWFKAS